MAWERRARERWGEVRAAEAFRREVKVSRSGLRPSRLMRR